MTKAKRLATKSHLPRTNKASKKTINEVIESVPYIKILACLKNNKKTCADIIRARGMPFKRALSSIARNILAGNVRLKKSLTKKQRQHIEALAKNQYKHLNQHGGFIGAVLKTVIPAILGLALNSR